MLTNLARPLALGSRTPEDCEKWTKSFDELRETFGCLGTEDAGYVGERSQSFPGV